MNFEVKMDSGVMIIKPLHKSIDASQSTIFKGKIVDLINQGNTFLLLNLKDVDFIDSSGLGSFVSILKTLTLSHGDIALCEINPPILNLFKITRMDRVFHLFPSEMEGLTYLINAKSSTK